jgi:acetyl/propionyl-CoA carboxylase alpha subunit
LTGKVVELHPALVVLEKRKDTKSNSAPNERDRERLRVRKGEALVVLSVMKMEDSVVTPFDGEG